MIKKIATVLSLSFTLYACAPPSTVGTTSPSVAPEVGECLTNSTYSLPVIVGGTATFFKRNLIAVTSNSTTVQSLILGAPNTTPIPIRFAEIRVLNASGEVVQCGKTNEDGDLKAVDGTADLKIPNVPGNYTFQVFARTNHTFSGLPVGKAAFKVYASIKADIYSNEVQSISTVVNSTGVGSVWVDATAYARESESAEVRGGAFNIYNDIISTYTYLGQNTGISNLTCLNPKLDVFWRAGFNPAQYVYPSSDPSTLGTLSFYLRGQNQLYINGGRLGNMKTQDTDHFDDSVIIHELGHHIEDVCGKMDSPGGTHYGHYRIDPRLAWSEGWGNFLGAHIIRNNITSINPDLPATVTARDGWLYYLDTSGYQDGSGSNGSIYIMLNLNRSGTNPESTWVVGQMRYYDKVDPVLNPGEGHFREVSVARSLFKSTNTCTATCTNCSSCADANYFANYWKAFENDPTGIGMGKIQYPFRSSARFFSRLNQSFGGAMPASIDSILDTNEAQQRETNSAYTVSGSRVSVPYGIKLVPSATACDLKIQPKPSTGLYTDSNMDPRFSNHFYLVDLTSIPGVTQIRLTATKISGSDHDIDLILNRQSYTYVEDCTDHDAAGNCTAYQRAGNTSDMVRTDRSNGLNKQISTLNMLDPSQAYLLNVRSFPKELPVTASEYTYVLTDQSGGFLCPISNF